jgi:hypothetical protein
MAAPWPEQRPSQGQEPRGCEVLAAPGPDLGVAADGNGWRLRRDGPLARARPKGLTRAGDPSAYLQALQAGYTPPQMQKWGSETGTHAQPESFSPAGHDVGQVTQ